MREASHYYLGRDLEDADPAGIALLVGLIQAPNAYSPYSSPEKAKKRRDLVLRVLNEQGILDEREAKRAMAAPLPSRSRPRGVAEASYFLDAVRAEIERRAPKGTFDAARHRDLHDPRPTRSGCRRDGAARGTRAISNGIIASCARRRRRCRQPSSPIDPANGEVRALVGGRDYLTSPSTARSMRIGSPDRSSSRSSTWRPSTIRSARTAPTGRRRRFSRTSRSGSVRGARSGGRRTTTGSFAGR